MQETNNRKNRADQYLSPDHYDIRITKHTSPMSAVDPHSLFDSFPNREPPKANGEAQRDRGDDQVTIGNLLGFVVRGEEGYHGMLEELSFGRGASGFVFHRVYRGLEDAKEGERKKGTQWVKF